MSVWPEGCHKQRNALEIQYRGLPLGGSTFLFSIGNEVCTDGLVGVYLWGEYTEVIKTLPGASWQRDRAKRGRDEWGPGVRPAVPVCMCT